MESNISRPAIFSCRHVAKSFNNVDVFNDVTFSIQKGEKVALVGSNGVGKSTLLRICARDLLPDDGKVVSENNIDSVYFPQIQVVDGMSGGEKAKQLLSRIASSGAQLFFLDEPTNNLDVEGLERLESFVKSSPHAFLVVSHDRMFLDRTVTKIIELDSDTKTAKIYAGNYSAYLQERYAETERTWKTYNDAKEKTTKLSREVRQRIGWKEDIEKRRHSIKKLPMHEREKPVAAELRDQEGRAGRRARIIKDRLLVHEKKSASLRKPLRKLPLYIQFDPVRGSTKVFELRGITKVIGGVSVGPITASIQYGDRVHIAGRNGSGKTTLIQMLTGLLHPDQGVLEKGENIHIGYIPQFQIQKDQTALEYFLSHTSVGETNGRKILNRFRLTSEDVHKLLIDLSPGQYSRLLIAVMYATQPNCIILDEPTNHLDLEVVGELERALADFSGTLIVASHDRYFVDRINLKKEISLG